MVLLVIAGILAWFLAPAPTPEPVAVASGDSDEMPFMRLDSILKKKKTRVIRDAAAVQQVEQSAGDDGQGVIRLSERKISMPTQKHRAKTWTWSSSPSYTGLFNEPPPPINPSYREVMDAKGEEIARRIGLDLSFGPTMEAAFNNQAIERAEKLQKDGRREEALKAFKELLKHDNLMVRAIAGAWVTKILEEMGGGEEFKAARANLAVLSAQVAAQAFPDLVKRMGAESPAVKEAFDKLIGGDLIRLP